MGFYIQLGARWEGEGSGRGGKHTQPSGVVKRLRVGSTDCVGLTSRLLTHARAHGKSFSPPVSFGLFQRFMCGCKRVYVYVRVLRFRVILARHYQAWLWITIHLTSVRLLTFCW
jgi:hypothetical protein